MGTTWVWPNSSSQVVALAAASLMHPLDRVDVRVRHLALDRHAAPVPEADQHVGLAPSEGRSRGRTRPARARPRACGWPSGWAPRGTRRRAAPRRPRPPGGSSPRCGAACASFSVAISEAVARTAASRSLAGSAPSARQPRRSGAGRGRRAPRLDDPPGGVGVDAERPARQPGLARSRRRSSTEMNGPARKRRASRRRGSRTTSTARSRSWVRSTVSSISSSTVHVALLEQRSVVVERLLEPRSRRKLSTAGATSPSSRSGLQRGGGTKATATVRPRRRAATGSGTSRRSISRGSNLVRPPA